MPLTQAHLDHKIAQARVDGAQAVLLLLTEAGQLSPLQVEAFRAAMQPMQALEATAWKAYMGDFESIAPTTAVRTVGPVASLHLSARHRRYQRAQERRTATHPHVFLPSAAFPTH